MRKLLHFILFLSFTVFFSDAKASRVLGSETAWSSLGNDTFELTFTIYLSCTSGGTFTPVAPLITSDSSASTDTINVGSYYAWTMEDITPLCKSATRICAISGGNGTGNASVPEGIEKNEFKYKIYLGGVFKSSCWYKIHWEYFGRTSTITTGLADTKLISDAWLNRCAGSNNNSPTFKTSPILLKCAGQDVIYNPGTSETDGDSLSFLLAPPADGIYTSPWSYTYPVTCLGGNNPNQTASPATGFNINTNTGELLFRPMQVQISVLKVVVFEWRKDSLGVFQVIGKTSRDMEIVVIQTCNNKQPTISGAPSYEACVGQQICITMNTADIDFADTTRIYWNKGIPGAVWSENNGTVKHGTGTLCWTPTDLDANERPYTFAVTVEDDHCPLLGNSTKIYSITVRPTPKNTRTYTKITCNLIEFKAIPTNSAYTASTYKWYVPVLIGSGSPLVVYSGSSVCQYEFTQGGTYLLKNTMFFNGCTNTYFDTLQVDSNPSLHITGLGDTILCPGETNTLVCDSAASYQWYNDGVIIPGATSKTYVADKAGSYDVRKYKTGCYVKSNTISITETAKLFITKTNPICEGDSVTYSVIGKPGATFQWYRNGAQYSGTSVSAITTKQDGIYYCRVIQTGCNAQTNADTLSFLPLPSKPSIIHNGLTLYSTSAFTFQWYFDTLPIPNATVISYNPPKSGSYRVKVTGTNGCGIFSDPINYNVGIKDKTLLERFNISPNPFHDYLKLKIKDEINPVIVLLYDMQGKLMKQQTTINGEVELNTLNLSQGLYILEVRDGETMAMFKVEKL